MYTEQKYFKIWIFYNHLHQLYCRIEDQLDIATKSFLNQEVQISKTVDDDAVAVNLSKLFLWYGRDFGVTDVDMLGWITKYVSFNYDENTNIVFSDYDWVSNSK